MRQRLVPWIAASAVAAGSVAGFLLTSRIVDDALFVTLVAFTPTPMLASIAGMLVHRLGRSAFLRATPDRRLADGRRAAVEGAIFARPALEAPGLGTACAAFHVRYVRGAQREIVGGRFEVGSVALRTASGRIVPLEPPVAVEWARATSRTVPASDASMALDRSAARGATDAVVTFVPVGAQVVATGVAVSEARASELSGYRSLAREWRLVAPQGEEVRLHPVRDRRARRLRVLGVVISFAMAATAAPLGLVALVLSWPR